MRRLRFLGWRKPRSFLCTCGKPWNSTTVGNRGRRKIFALSVWIRWCNTHPELEKFKFCILDWRQPNKGIQFGISGETATSSHEWDSRFSAPDAKRIPL